MSAGTSLTERYGPRALILGGSEGIGAEFADLLAGAGLDLTLVARSAGALNETAARIRDAHGVEVDVIELDLTAPDIPSKAGDIIAARDFGLVIYNAGATHSVNLFLDQPVDRALNLVALNCASPVAFAHAALGKMREKGRGGLSRLTPRPSLSRSCWLRGCTGNCSATGSIYCALSPRSPTRPPCSAPVWWKLRD
jgi:short-subunit dehydrogenase